MAGELAKVHGCGIQRTTHSIIRSLSPTSGSVSSFLGWRRFVELFCFDAEYVRRLRAADPVIEEHFAGYFSELLTIKLRARRADSGEIDEVTQETFFRVLRALRSNDTIRSAERLGAFVNSVCNNIWYEQGRIKRRTEPLPDDYEERSRGNDDVETALLSAEEEARVRQVLDTLPEKDALLLRWTFIEERPKDEVCAALNVTRDYLRVLLHRALKQFRRRYLKRIDKDERT